MNIQRTEWFAYRGTDRHLKASDRLALRLTAADDAQGWSDFSYRSDMRDWLPRLQLTGRDATQIDLLWDELYAAGTPLDLLASVDVALWDLRGRQQGKPVHSILGSQRDRVKVYVHTPFNLGGPDVYAGYAADWKREGFHGFKVHPTITWGATWNDPRFGKPDEDLAIYRAVREAVGPGTEYALTTDNYNTYDYDTALRVGRVVEELGYKWYESPMPETDEWIDRYVALRRALNVPVCAPECAPGSWEVRARWIDRGACDISRIDIYMGGFTPCVRLAEKCRQAGIPLELHTFGEFYHLQLLGATPESLVEYMESGTTWRDGVLMPESSRRVGEILKRGWLTPEPLADAQGYMAIPQTPGMGVELDWEWIEHNTL